MKKLLILLLLALIFPSTSLAISLDEAYSNLASKNDINYTYRDDVEKWVVAVYVGMLGYYGSYCGQISPTFRAYTIMSTSQAFSINVEDVQTKTLKIMITEEFREGAQLVKNLGCSSARKMIESDARTNGINESLE